MPASAQECAASATIAAEPVNPAAMDFAMATRMLATKAMMTVTLASVNRFVRAWAADVLTLAHGLAEAHVGARTPDAVACFLIGHVAHYVLLWFGGYMGTLGSVPFILFAPLAVLARLLTFVAMFLITRNHPPPQRDRAEGCSICSGTEDGLDRGDAFQRRAVLRLLLRRGFLPRRYGEHALGHRSARRRGVARLGAQPEPLCRCRNRVRCQLRAEAAVGEVQEKLPLWTRLIAVYLQVVWVLVVVYAAGTIIEVAEKWFKSRSVVAWARGIGDWFATNVAPVAAAWEALLAVIGVALALTVTALAWLAIAGVVFGESINAQRPSFAFVGLTRAKERYDRIDSRMRRRLKDSASLAIGRFLPLWQAFVLMLRAGPGLIGLHILLFQLCLLIERWLGGAIPHPSADRRTHSHRANRGNVRHNAGARRIHTWVYSVSRIPIGVGRSSSRSTKSPRNPSGITYIR